jgi:tetratricopeptide (TPR) repeat protein
MKLSLLVSLAFAAGTFAEFGALGAQDSTAPRGAIAATVPLFEGLGPHTRKVTTDSDLAQRYFNQGLAFLHAFNHDEAIRSFEEATRQDPGCSMAWWGIAFANGPHINFPAVPPDRALAAWEALGKAEMHASKGTQVEQALIRALGRRYAHPQPEDRAPLDQAFADAMREVWRAYPGDADVGAFFAESLMDLRPWDLWTPEGEPQPGTDEVVSTLEAVLALDLNHPLANHLFVHAVEASPNPGLADGAADRLRDLQPGMGHNVHMPSHIDVRRGRWHEAITANTKAIAADRIYRETSQKPPGFYRLYMAHNQHMLAWAAMMSGQQELAMRHIRQMVADIPLDFLEENASWMDAFAAMPYEVMIRFGRWDEMLAQPQPADYLPLSRALYHAARGIAFAAKGDVPAARAEQAAFTRAAAAVPEGFTAGNNTAAAVLAVAGPMLEGEIRYRAGEVEAGLARLRDAVAAEDALRYDEPPGWILPVRHALGASLMKERLFAQAEQVYRDDLARLPENGWSLYGLAQALRHQGKHPDATAFDQRFKEMWSKADLQITSSCLCVPGAAE